MSISFEDKATDRGATTSTIGQGRVQPALDQAFNRVKKNLNAPGFRKEHMPRAVSDQKFSEGALYEGVLNTILSAAYETAVAELSLNVVAQPKIDIQSMEKGQKWTLTAGIVIEPEVKPSDYKDLKVSVKATGEVTGAKVDEKVERKRSNLAKLIIKEDAMELGDTVVIDFIGSIGGVESDGGKGDNFSLEPGSGRFTPDSEDQSVSIKTGGTVEVDVTFPENYQAEDFAGRDAKFVIAAHEVKAREVPAFDDELAKGTDKEVETLDELKAKYHRELGAAKEIAYDGAVEDAIFKLAVANTEIIKLSEEMIHDEVRRAINGFMGNMQRQGTSPEMYFQPTGTTGEDLHRQYETDTDKRVKTSPVIEATAKAKGFGTSDKGIEKKINNLASEYNMEAKQVHDLLSVDMLKHDIAMKKAVNVVTSIAKVK